MSTQHYYRLWCKKCEDWRLFDEHITPDIFHECKTCGTTHVPTLLRDIPEAKITEQRNRYKEKKKKDFQNLFGTYLQSGFSPKNPLEDMFSEKWPELNITESDAGQKAIDDENRRIYEEQQQALLKLKQEQKEEVAKYKHLGRNDKCICGSNLKYKKCCLSKIESYGK